MHKPRTRPASWPWLLVHELRLGWRDIGEFKAARLVAIVGTFWLLSHLATWAMMRNITLERLMGTPMIAILGAVYWLMVTMTLSFAVSMTVGALYDRGDLDLLLSSPIEVRTVFTVRGIGIALRAVFWPALILLPFAHGGILHGHWGLMAAYPMLLSLGLAMAALAFCLTLGLVKSFGVRRARVIAQILGAASGAMMFLLSQAYNLLPRETAQRIGAGFQSAAHHGWFSSTSVLWWPVRGLFGDPLPFITVLAVSVLLFVSVVYLAPRTFMQGIQDAFSVRPSAKRPSSMKPVRFRSGTARAVIRKELLLIARDTQLISQCLLQMLYMVPMMVIIFRHGDAAHFLAPAIVLLTSTLATNLAFITVDGEEAPDLTGSAPVLSEKIRWLKATAAVMPVLAMAMPFFAYYLTSSLKDAFIFITAVLLALLSVAMIQVWSGKPATMRDLRRRGRNNPFAAIMDSIVIFGWAGATYGLMNGSWLALIGIAAGTAAPAWAWSRGRAGRNSGR